MTSEPHFMERADVGPPRSPEFARTGIVKTVKEAEEASCSTRIAIEPERDMLVTNNMALAVP
jgi:hypothetical protein